LGWTVVLLSALVRMVVSETTLGELRMWAQSLGQGGILHAGRHPP
jgi:hypothetical protein